MNGNSVEINTPISHDQKKQAETFFKVMVQKGWDVPEMADTMGHMGKMLLEYSKRRDD